MTEYLITLNDEPEEDGCYRLTKPAEEIVRCRDCKYYHDGTSNGRRYAEPHCLAIGELAYGALFEVGENDFCSWAERKEGGDD